MIDKELIKNKLADLSGYYKELTNLTKNDTPGILGDSLKLHSLERLFQLIVDIAIDINTHIISEMNLEVPGDYQSSFITLGENKILPMDFSLRIAPSVGMRNLIVHRYGKADLKKVVEDIRNEIGDYETYMKYIGEFISKSKNTDA